MEHWKAIKKVMRYLQGTKDHMLTYRRSNHLKVIGYSDSYFVGCVVMRKFTLGYVFLLVGGVISWKSAKQPVVVVASTMEVEFVACCVWRGWWLLWWLEIPVMVCIPRRQSKMNESTNVAKLKLGLQK